MSALILDTETTGIDEPEVIEMAWLGPLTLGPLEGPMGPTCGGSQSFRPSKPISLGAMATHHIIDSDLLDCPPWQGWIAPAGIEYLIGHNCDFDWKALGQPNLKRICTLALSRHLWPQLDSHTLTAMTYHIYEPAHARAMVRAAHSAVADVTLCHHLLGRIWIEVGKPCDWEAMWQISELARVPTTFSFGKYKGERIDQIRRTDRNYIQWCLSGKCDLVNEDPYLRKALTN